MSMLNRWRTIAGVLAVTTALVACGSSNAGPSGGPTSATVSVSKPWIRTTPAGATNAAAYVVLSSLAGDTLNAAEVDAVVAASATLHQTTSTAAADTTMAGSGTTMSGTTVAGSGTTMAGASDEMSMAPVASIALPAGQSVALAPGGYHIMLDGLVKPLTKGETVTIQLIFTKAGTKDITFTVSDDAP